MLSAQAPHPRVLVEDATGLGEEFRFDDATGIVIGETRGIEGNDFHHILFSASGSFTCWHS